MGCRLLFGMCRSSEVQAAEDAAAVEWIPVDQLAAMEDSFQGCLFLKWSSSVVFRFPLLLAFDNAPGAGFDIHIHKFISLEVKILW